MSDRIVLTVATEPALRGVASLVLGGIGSRLELSYERTDDLQLAVLSALEQAAGDSVTVEVEASDDTLSVSVGPLVAGAVSDAALARVLARLVDEVDGAAHDGREWLTLRLARARTA